MPHARQFLLQAGDESEMNDWINLINYACAFKTADVRIRASLHRADQAESIGATSSALQQRAMRQRNTTEITEIPERSQTLSLEAMANADNAKPESSPSASDVAPAVEASEPPNAKKVVGPINDQLEEFFGVVKADSEASRLHGGSKGDATARADALPAGSFSANVSTQTSREAAISVSPLSFRQACIAEK